MMKVYRFNKLLKSRNYLKIYFNAKGFIDMRSYL